MNAHPNRQRREGAAAEHRAILDIVLGHDVEGACRLLSEHNRTTLDGLREVLLGQPPAAGSARLRRGSPG